MGESAHTVRLHDGELDLEAGRVRRGTADHTLTPLELRLVRHLVAQGGRAVSREALLVEVWGYAPGVVSRAVDKTLHRLRAKLEPDPARPQHLCAQPGEGVRWRPVVGDGPGAGASLLGRDRVFGDLARALDAGGGLFQIVGRGGMGKTTLARAQWERWRRLGGDALWVDLAAARSLAGLERRLGGALGLPPAPDQADRLGPALAGRDGLLLVLDNLEQLPDGLGPCLEAWAAAAPKTRFLCTSRAALAVSGQTHLLAPLAAEHAQALFCARAREVDRALGLDPADPAVARIVAAVDHLPLAIELAAARVDVCGLSVLAERLGNSAAWLTRSGPGPARHATMEAVLQWTWDLLSPLAQRALWAATFYQEPVGLPGLEAVAHALGPSDRGMVADAVADLRRRGLLARQHSGEGPRFVLHRTVRHFVAARVPGSHRDAAEAAHAAHVLAAGRAALEALHGAQAAAALSRLGDLSAELWRAAGRASDPGPWSHCLQPVFKTRGPVDRWLDLADRSVVGAQGPAALAQALGNRGYARLVASDLAGAQADLDRALALPAEGAPEAWCMAAIRRAFVADLQGQPDRAAQHLADALAQARQQRMPRVVALARADQGIHLWRCHQFEAAEAAFADADARLQALGDRVQRAVLALNRGHNLRVLGQRAQASTHLGAAVRGAAALGFLRVGAVAHLVLVDLAPDRAAAEVHVQAGLALGRRLASPELVGVAWTRRAAWALQVGDAAAARAALTQAAIRLEGLPSQATDGAWFGQGLRTLAGMAHTPLPLPAPAAALAPLLLAWEAALGAADPISSLRLVGRRARTLQHPDAPDLRRLVQVALGRLGTR